ncbi:MAG TPA: response regulator [Steroidobacteraceae bacterium]|nr:response regulator [Steroidobacteraceae bacterium]
MHSDHADRIAARRILVVEDEYLIAADLARQLEAAGVEVLGPVPTVAAALDLLARTSDVDGAVLDVNLRGENVLPVAATIRERGIPFVFATGYDKLALPGEYAGSRWCQKPVDVSQVLTLLFD